MTDLETLLRETLHDRADRTPTQHRVLARTLGRTPRRVRRPRRTVVAVALVGSAAAAVVGVSALTQSSDSTHEFADGSPQPSQSGGPDVRREPTPSTSPDPSALPTAFSHAQELRLLERLAEALPGPSTPGEVTDHTAPGPALQAISATREYDGGTVLVGVQLGGVDLDDVVKMCETVGTGHAQGTNCVVTEAGWAITSSGRADTAAQQKFTDVRYYGRDGAIVHLQATNTAPAGGAPVSDAVLTVDELVALATATDWYV